MHTDAFVTDNDTGAPVYETLALLPSYGLEVLPDYVEIVHDLGDSYQAVAQMGGSQTVEYFTYRFGTVTQTTSQAILVNEFSDVQEEIIYLRNFLNRHRRARPFYITHPITKLQQLVVIVQFSPHRLNSPYLWESGLVMRSWFGSDTESESSSESSLGSF